MIRLARIALETPKMADETDPFTALSAQLKALLSIVEALLVRELARHDDPEMAAGIMRNDLYLKQPHLRDPSGPRVPGPERLASEMVIGIFDRAPKAARIARIVDQHLQKSGPRAAEAQEPDQTLPPASPKPGDGR